MAAVFMNGQNTQASNNNEAGTNGNNRFEKSDRAINFQFAMEKDDGTTFNVKLATGWLKENNADHVDLIEFLDEKPENLKELFLALAEASTYVDLTKKKAQRKPAFLVKK